MSDFVLSCCSTADLTAEHFQQRGISYICFHYELDGKEYPDDCGKTMDFETFYQAMTDGADTKTSQVNTGEFEAYFEPFLKEGKDIVHVCLSSGISGVINSANVAKAELEERYPERRIYVVDSLGASSGYGLLMDRLADLRDQGMSAKEVYEWALEHRLNVHHWFFSTDLKFYVKGGRISKTSGFVGGMLGICPLLNMDDQGRLIPRSKIRTKRKVIQAIVDRMEENADGGREYSGKCYISQSPAWRTRRRWPAWWRNVSRSLMERWRSTTWEPPSEAIPDREPSPLFFLGKEKRGVAPDIPGLQAARTGRKYVKKTRKSRQMPCAFWTE